MPSTDNMEHLERERKSHEQQNYTSFRAGHGYKMTFQKFVCPVFVRAPESMKIVRACEQLTGAR